MSAASSQASADSIMDSPELGFDTPSSVSRILGGEPSSPTTSPEFLSTTKFVKSQKAHDPNDCERWEESPVTNTLSPRDGSAPSLLIFSAAASPAKTFRLPDDEQGSQELVQDSSMSSPESLNLFDLDGYSSR